MGRLGDGYAGRIDYRLAKLPLRDNGLNQLSDLAHVGAATLQAFIPTSSEMLGKGRTVDRNQDTLSA